MFLIRMVCVLAGCWLLFGCTQEGAPPDGPPVALPAPDQVISGAANIRLSSQLPFAMNKNELDSSFVYGRSGAMGNAIVVGKGSAKKGSKPPKNLAVFHVAHPDTAAVVRLDLGGGAKGDLLHMLRQRPGESAAPVLVDVHGQAYHAVGFVIASEAACRFHFDAQKPVRKLATLDIGSVGNGQKLWLYFVIPKGADQKVKTLGRVRHGAHDLQSFPYFPKGPSK